MGVAFLNEGKTHPKTGQVTDARSFMSIKLDAVPVNSEMVLIAPKPGDDAGE